MDTDYLKYSHKVIIVLIIRKELDYDGLKPENTKSAWQSRIFPIPEYVFQRIDEIGYICEKSVIILNRYLNCTRMRKERKKL